MKPYRTSPASAQTAKQRLQSLLAHERALIASSRKHVSISLRGTRSGLSIKLGSGDWRDMLTELGMRLHEARARSFFQGARVQLESGGRRIEATELDELVSLLTQYGMALDTLDGQRVVQERRAPARPTVPPPIDLRRSEVNYPRSEVAYPPPPPPSAAPKPVVPQTRPPEVMRPVEARDQARALLIRRSIPAGQIVHEKGTVVILGDIGPAAEVVAEGDVIVCGKLRGIAWAGSAGDESRFVAALIFVPTQIRIASHNLGTMKDGGKFSWLSQIARVRDGRIIVEPWGV